MKLKIISLITASILLSACGSSSDVTYSSTNGYGSTNNGSYSNNGSSKNNNTPTVPESVLPVNVSKAPKGPAAYAIFENLNHPQDIQNSKENFTKAQLSQQLQQPVYSSPKTVTATETEDKQ